jgi:hypothetical protein
MGGISKKVSRVLALGAAVATLCILAIAPFVQTKYVGSANAASVTLGGYSSWREPQQALRLVSCRSAVESHCRNQQASCLRTSRSTRSQADCRARFRCCLHSNPCLGARYVGPLHAAEIDRKGRAPCGSFLFPHTCREGCNPRVQRCLCSLPSRTIRGTRNPDGSIEVRPPGR